MAQEYRDATTINPLGTVGPVIMTEGADGLYHPASGTNPIPISGGGSGGSSTPAVVGTFTDRSGTTTGAASQQVAAINLSRTAFMFQNVSDEEQWLNFTADANPDQPSIKVLPNAFYEFPAGFVSTEKITLYGASAGKAFTAKEGQKVSVGASLTDHSGSITVGGTAQSLMGANTGRKYLFIQNLSGHAMWINFGATAVADEPSIEIHVGGSYEPLFIDTRAISIIASGTGDKFVAKEG